MATETQMTYAEELEDVHYRLDSLCDFIEDGLEYSTYAMFEQNEGLSRERKDEVLDYLKTLRHIEVALGDMVDELEEDWDV